MSKNKTKPPQGNPFKAHTISSLLIKFSAPAIAGMFVSAFYNIISRVYVGHQFGSLGIAAISLLFPMGFLFMAFSMLIGVGANALFSIRLGEKNEDEAQLILGNAFVLLTIVSITIMTLFYIYMEPALRFLGADEAVMPYAVDYLKVVLPGYCLFNIGEGINAFIRSSGHPKTAMGSQLIGGVLNLIVAPLTIFVLGWGMEGAATATVCGQVASFSWMVLFFMSKRSKYRLRLKYMKLKWNIIYNSLLIGFSQFAFQMATSVLNFILNHALLRYGGNLAVSAMGIAISSNAIFIMPLFGLSQGAQPLIGYNYGARKYKTSIQTLKMAIRWATGLATAGFLVTEIFAPYIVRIFNNTDEHLIKQAAYTVRVMNLMLPFVGFQVLTTSFFQAINKPVRAAALSLSRQVLLIIPLVLILPLFWGLNGVYFSPPLADLISCVIAYFLLKKYFDKHKQNFFFSKKFCPPNCPK